MVVLAQGARRAVDRVLSLLDTAEMLMMTVGVMMADEQNRIGICFGLLVEVAEAPLG